MRYLLNHFKYNPVSSFLFRRYYQLRYIPSAQMIFVATTGRSGTMTLVDIFNHIPHCKAEHEPYPVMYNEALKAKSAGNEDFVRKLYWHIKSVNLWRSAAGFHHYFESNHLFIKTYIEYAAEDFGNKLTIIHLTRDAIKVANSIYSLQDFPGTVEGNKWWLDYTAANNLINIIDYLDNDTEFKHPFYKGLWYWYEIEARVKDWKQRLPQVRFIEFKTEDFNDQDKTFQLLRDLNIEFDPQHLASHVCTRSHARAHQKTAEPLPLKQAIEMNQKFRNLLISLNFQTETVQG